MPISRRMLIAATAPFVLPAISTARQATPATDFSPATERMDSLLQYAPSGNFDWEAGLIWCDVERQMFTIREQADSATDDYSSAQLAMRGLYANVPDFFSHAMFMEDFAGYTLDTVSQVIQYGSPLALSQLMLLDTSAEELVPFWESVDYEERENEYGRFWTIGEGPTIDFAHPVQRSVMARFNNIAILDDNILLYASTADLLLQPMAIAAGDEPNGTDELEAMSAGFYEDTTGIWHYSEEVFTRPYVIDPSTMLDGTIDQIEDMLAESADAVGDMPRSRSFVIGTTAGAAYGEDLHNPDAREFIILELASAGTADQAAAVLEWRLENMRSMNTGTPHSELLPDADVEVIDDQHVRISKPMHIPRPVFTEMIMSRDTLLFVYD